MKLEIVTHCWRYSKLLTYHLSSLVKNPPHHNSLQMTVVYADDDQPTINVLDFFSKQSYVNVNLNLIKLPQPMVCCRTIGRNKAALVTEADWIWFCDCDYWFGQESIDHLAEVLKSVNQEVRLVFPKVVQASRTQELGDQVIKDADGDIRLLDIKPENFSPLIYRKAIGGIQIVRGNYAREKGYLNGTKRWMRPAAGWKRTSEDVHFRRFLGSSGTPIETKNIYRIRHSERGGHGKDVIF